MRWTLPNVLTLLRLLAAPAVAVMFLYFHRPAADWFALVLFLAAAATDFVDGYLARLWGQETRFGAMLDPIADKAMVVIAIVVITALHGLDPWILLPATVILFREVFVSGLREYLGDRSRLLSVTRLAKWKTTAQMIAIAVLFAHGIFAHRYGMLSYGLDGETVAAILNGDEPGPEGLRTAYGAMLASWQAGIGLLWLAAAMTLLSGADYLLKAMPYLRERGKA